MGFIKKICSVGKTKTFVLMALASLVLAACGEGMNKVGTPSSIADKQSIKKKPEETEKRPVLLFGLDLRSTTFMDLTKSIIAAGGKVSEMDKTYARFSSHDIIPETYSISVQALSNGTVAAVSYTFRNKTTSGPDSMPDVVAMLSAKYGDPTKTTSTVGSSIYQAEWDRGDHFVIQAVYTQVPGVMDLPAVYYINQKAALSHSDETNESKKKAGEKAAKAAGSSI